MKYCSNCGNKIEDTSFYCPHCGQQTENPKEHPVLSLQNKLIRVLQAMAVIMLIMNIILYTGKKFFWQNDSAEGAADPGNVEETASEIAEEESGSGQIENKTEQNGNDNTAAASSSKIPEDAMRYNGHSYYIYDNVASSWEEAEKYCESLGGHLAVIEDANENETLYQYMLNRGFVQTFIGYSDSQKEGTWVWVNGSDSKYTDWGVNDEGELEPNSDSVKENYCQLDINMFNGYWNDCSFGNDTTSFICEWDEP